jgi:hypothetical protein
MRKMPAVVLIVGAALMIGSAAPMLVSAQTGGRTGPAAAGNAEDIAHRTARSFAPFVRALITRRITTAQQLFKMRRNVLMTLEQPEVIRVLSRYQRPQRYDLNLVAGRLFGQNAGILLFTVINEDGPVYFKVYYYAYGDQTYIDRLEISDDWDDLEAAAERLESLPTVISVPVSVGPETGG